MLSEQEQLFADAFQQKLLTEADPMELDTGLIQQFILFGHQVIRDNYDNRGPILTISNYLKRKCQYIVSNTDKKGKQKTAVKTIWDLRLFEAQNRQLDSYLLFLEKKRDPKEKFYQPKRRQFWKTGIIPALQDMLDDKLDLLTISMPPGTGKAQPLYSKVLTPDGFIRMGEISVGDIMLSAYGDKTRVSNVFPQGEKDVYEFTLDGNRKFRCSDEHLCPVLTWRKCGKCYEKVVEAHEIVDDPKRFMLPIYDNGISCFLRITNVEYIGKEECQCIVIDDPSHLYVTDDYIVTHNSTISRFFMTGVIGWFPNEYNLFFSHSDGITRKYYDDALKIVTDRSEYAWQQIFPDLKVNHQNAKAQEFNVGKEKIFNSLQCSTRGSNNAGMVRASKYLLVDDMIAKIEEALNKTTLDKLWGVYSTDARQRKTVDVNKKPCKEIHIATRWSVHDIIGRLQVIYDGNERCRFIAIPDIDPDTGKSNFDYDYQGFTTEFFHDIELTMDDISYRCLYKNAPIEREGLLYHEDDLRRFYSLPGEEPDAVIAVCDTKAKGIDYMVLPVLYKYDDDYYLVDCVCDDNSDFAVQKRKLTDILVNHGVQQCEFESNAGGDRLAADVADMVRAEGGRCNITTKATETNKETRIIVNSDWVKKHVLFKSEDQYMKKSDYGRFMNFLTTYTVAGRNAWDDVPDCMANFALFVTRSLYRRKTRIMRSPI